MDQVKVYLGVAKKHHFWILITIVVITAIVVWIKASGTLAANYAADKAKIEMAEKAVQGLKSGEQVNNKFTEKVEKLHEGLKQSVFEAWQKLYDRQVALFHWPIVKIKQGGKEAEIDLNSLKPDDDIPQVVRTYYNEHVVQNQWTDLLEKVNLRKPKKLDEPASDSDEGDEEEQEEVAKRSTEYEGLVVWKEDLRKAIISRYYTENVTPSTKRLRLMQEDAWLFDSLIDIVNTVNRGATDPLRAPIKEIDVLDVAQWAIAASLQSGATMSGGSSMGGMSPGGMGGGAMAAAAAQASSGKTSGGAAGGATAAADGASGASDKDWEDGRYLDDKGQPLSGNNQPFAEFRQMFVYMKFIMDQRKIPDLIAACANAPLPIETRQVRVQTLKDDQGAGGGGLFPGGGGGMNPSGAGGTAPQGMMGGMAGGTAPPGMASGAAMGGMGNYGGATSPMPGGGMGGMGGMMGGMGGMMGGMGGMMGGMGGMMGGMGGLDSAGVQEGGVETTVYDGVVELSGVIYLYNPPDMAKLGQGGAASPEKRSFGVPKTAPKVPGNSTGGIVVGGMGGPSPGGPQGASGGPPAQAPPK